MVNIIEKVEVSVHTIFLLFFFVYCICFFQRHLFSPPDSSCIPWFDGSSWRKGQVNLPWCRYYHGPGFKRVFIWCSASFVPEQAFRTGEEEGEVARRIEADILHPGVWNSKEWSTIVAFICFVFLFWNSIKYRFIRALLIITWLEDWVSNIRMYYT